MKYILRRWNIFSKGQITAQRDSSGKSKMTEQLTLLNDIISLLSHRQQKHLKLIWNKRERRNHCLHISEQQYWVGKQSAWDFQTTRWQSLHKQVELWGTPYTQPSVCWLVFMTLPGLASCLSRDWAELALRTVPSSSLVSTGSFSLVTSVRSIHSSFTNTWY